MTPLRITAQLRGAIIMTLGSIELDALLMAVRARELGLPPAAVDEPMTDVQIPIEREQAGRFFLCSSSLYNVERSDVHRIVKRPILKEKIRHNCRGSLNDQGGPDKAWNEPLETLCLRDDQIDWYCDGDAAEIERLLSYVTHLGKKRSHGFGEVLSWTVAPCETWDGFPVLLDGKPLRPLPAGYPGLVDPPLAYRVLSPPYWQHHREELVACPSSR